MKIIHVKLITKGFKVVYEKVVANEHYMITDQSGKSFDKLKFVQKNKNLEVYIENEGKELKIAILEDYYAPNINASIVSLDTTTTQEVGYITQNDGWSYTSLVETSSMGILGYSAIGLGVIGTGIALGGGGSSGGGTTSAPTTPSTVPVTLEGTISVGPIVSTNGLKVNLYKADGTLLVENINVDDKGTFKTTISGYTGVIIAKIILDTDVLPDYMDESTLQGKDLSTSLMAVGVITAGVSITLNINPVTTIAASKAGISLGSNTNPMTTETATEILSINTAVGNAFGLTNITTAVVTPVINSDGVSQTPNNYGIVLAILSGIDKANNGDVEATISQIATQLNISGTSNTITQEGEGLLIQGALNSNISVSQLTNILNPNAANVASDLGNDLSKNDISNLSPIFIANLSSLQIQSLTSTQVASLTATQITALGDNLSSLSPTAIASITSIQLSALTTAQIYALGVAGLLDNLTQSFSISQVQALSSNGATITLEEATLFSSVINSIIDGNITQEGLFDSSTKIQNILDSINAVINCAAGRTVSTMAQLKALGITGVDSLSEQNQATIQAAIAATADDGSGVDTIAKLQAVVNSSIDTTAPVALTLALATDSGSNTTDGITNVATVNVSGLEAGATWEYKVDTNSWTAGTGTSFAAIAGSHIYSVRQTDSAGNVGTASSEVTYELDITAPTAGTIALISYTDLGSSATDKNSNDKTFDLTISGNEVGSTVAYQVSTNGGTTWIDTTAVQSALSDGTYSFRAVVTDTSGNSANTPVVVVVVDTTAPTGLVINAIASDDIINANEQTSIISGTCEANATVSLTIGANTRTATVTGTSWSYTLIAEDITAMAEGVETISATQTDSAGNTQVVTRDITVDTVLPTGLVINAIAIDDIINANEQTSIISGTCEANATVDLTIAGNTRTATVTGTSWSYTLIAEDITAMAEGVETISTTQTDRAGNTSTATTRDITVDTIAPTSTLTTATLKNTDSAIVQSNEIGTAYIVNSTLTQPTSLDELITLETTNDTSVNKVSITTVNTPTSLSLVGLVDGIYKLYTVDSAGNLSLVSSDFIKVDTTTPTISNVEITAATNSQNNYLNKDDELTISVTMSEVVSINTTLGSPTITLIVGLTEVLATYDAASSSSTLLKFKYIIEQNQTDTNGISIKANSFNLNNSIIQDVAGNIATLSFDTVSDNVNYKVDTSINQATISLGSFDYVNDQEDESLVSYSLSNIDADVITGGSVVATLSDGVHTINGTFNVDKVEFSSVNVKTLNQGNLTLSVKVKDEAGNEAVTTNSNIVYDNLVPNAPAVQPTSGTMLRGSSEAGVTIKIYSDAECTNELGSGVVESNGSFAISYTQQTNGTTIYYKATDLAQNVTVVSNITVTAPIVNIISISDDTGASNNDFITNISSQTLNGIVEGTFVVGSDKVQVKVGSGSWVDATVTSTGVDTYSWSLAGVTLSGTQLIEAKIVNSSDIQLGQIASHSVTLDTVFTSTTPVLEPIDNSIISPNIDFRITFDEEITKGSGNIIISDDTLSTTQIIDVTSSNVTISADKKTLIINPDSNLIQNHNYHIEMVSGAIKDIAGNDYAGIAGNATDWNFTTGYATISLDSVTSDNRINKAEKDAGATFTISGTINSNVLADIQASDINVQLSTGGSTIHLSNIVYNSTTGVWSGTLTSTDLQDGQNYSITATINGSVNKALGVSSTASGSIYTDFTAPVIPIITSVVDNVGTITGAISSDGVTNDTELVLSGTAEANSTVTIYNGITLLGTTTTNESGDWIYTTSTLSNGTTYAFKATATDIAGNISSDSLVHNVVVDTTAPTVVADINTIAEDTVSISGDVSTNDTDKDGSEVYAVDGSTGAYGTIALSANGTYIYTLANANATVNALAAGDTLNDTINYKVTDAAGNSSTSSITITINGTNDAPVLADTALALTAVNEDAVTPTGTAGDLVSSLVSGISDVDASAVKGIAVTAVNSNGTLYYSIDSGTTWTAASGISGTASLLLKSDAATRVYFKPNSDYNGMLNDAITFRAWDTTIGTAGSKVDTSTNGATTSFSSATDTVSITVNAVPDITAVSISSATGALNSYLNAGDEVIVSVTFDEAVIVDTVGGTPKIALTIGSDTVYATYDSAATTALSDNKKVAFKYTILANQTDSDGISIDASQLSLNSGTIKSVATGNNATLTYSAVANNANYMVDATAPTAVDLDVEVGIQNTASAYVNNSTKTSGVSIAAAIQAPIETDIAKVTIVLSGAGLDTTNDKLTLEAAKALSADLSLSNVTIGGITGIDYTYTTSTKTLVLSRNGGGALSAADIDNIVAGIKFTTTSTTQGNRDFTISYTDLAGNVSTSATATLVVDTSIPTTTVVLNSISISQDAGSSSTDFITNDNDGLTITGTLSAALVSGEKLMYSRDNGTTWIDITTSVTSTTISYVDSLLTSSSTIKMKVEDSAGNGGTAVSKAITIDTTPATIVNSINAQYILVSQVNAFAELVVYDINGNKLDNSTWTITGSDGTPIYGTTGSIKDNTLSNFWLGSSWANTNWIEVNLGSLKSIGQVVVYAEQTGRLAGAKVSLSDTNMLNVANTAIDTTKVNAATSFTLPSSMSVPPTNLNTPYPSGTVGAVMISATGAQNGYLNAGDVVTVSMGMTEVVTVTGTPQLSLNINGTIVQANYASGSGTNTLTFTYTILANQTDTDGISIDANSLSLNGGTIKDTAGNDATLIHNAVANNVNYMVDTTADSDNNMAINLGNFAHINDAEDESDVVYTITGLDSDVIASGTVVATLTDNAGTPVTINGTVDKTAGTVTFTSADIKTLAQGDLTLSVKATDLAGNEKTITNSTISYDTTVQTGTVTAVEILLDANNDTYINSTEKDANTTTNVKVTFDTDVKVGDEITYNLGGSDLTHSVIQADIDASRTFTISSVTLPSDGSTLTVSAKVTADAVGNPVLTPTVVTDTVTIDTTAPVAPTLALATDSGSNTTDGITNVATVNVSGLEAGATWEYKVDTNSWTAGIGTSFAAIAGSHIYSVRQTDSAGNVGTASSEVTYELDIVSPTATITMADIALKVGETSIVTITFSEEVSGFELADLTAENGTLSSLVQDVTDSKKYTAIFTPNSNIESITNVITLAATYTDTVGNSGTTSTSFNYVVDTKAPTGLVINAIAIDDIINASEQISIISGTCEAGATVDLTIGANTRTATVTGTSWSYTLISEDITAMAEGVETISATQTDSAGNTQVVTRDITVDTIAPSAASITSVTDDVGSIAGEVANNAITNDTTPTIKVSLVDTNAVAGDTVKLYNGSTEIGSYVLQVADITATFADVTTEALITDGSYTITVKITDVAGNTSTASASTIFTLDATPTTVSSVAIAGEIGALNSYLNAGDVVTVSMGMTEVVTVTGTPQLSLNIGGTTVQANYASGSGTNTLTFTYIIQSGQTDTDGISIDANSLSLNGGTIKDSAGNDTTLTHSLVANNASYMVDTTAIAPTITSVTDNVGVISSRLLDTVPTARYVMLTRETVSTEWDPAELQVMVGGVNVALGKTVTIGSQGIRGTYVKENLTDGSNSTFYHSNTASPTNIMWIMVDLGAEFSIDEINLIARNYGTYISRQSSVSIFTSTTDISATLGVSSSVDITTTQLTNLKADSISGITYVGTTVATGNTLFVNSFGDVTNDTTPTIKISLVGTNAVLGDTVKLYDGATEVGSYTLTAQNITGTFVNVTPTITTDGTHTITAKVVDVAGNVSVASGSTTFILDTTAPVAPSITSVTDDVGSIIGVVANNAITNDTTPTIKVSLTGTNAVAGDTIRIYSAGSTIMGNYVLQTADITANFADVTTNAFTTDGSYTITAKIIDKVGYTSNVSGSTTFTLDTSAPKASLFPTYEFAAVPTDMTNLYTGTNMLTFNLENVDTRDADLEEKLYGGATQTKHYHHINSKIMEVGEKLTAINTSFDFGFGSTGSSGINLSFGKASTLNATYYKQGYETGLSIRYSSDFGSDSSVYIAWNNQTIGTSSISLGASKSYSTNIQVDAAGNVTVNVTGDDTFTVTGTIPNSEWSTVNMDGWQFGYGGSSGSLTGDGWIDNLNIATPLNNSNIVVQSNEIGTAYIVNSTLTQPTSLAGLLALELANDTLVNSVPIETINTNKNMALTGLLDGVYKVYTVDAAGNLSLVSTSSIIIDATAPTAVDLDATAGIQNTARAFVNNLTKTSGVSIAAAIQAPIETDIAKVTIVLSGAGLDTVNDKLTLEAVKALNANFSGTNKTINGIAGIDYTYTASTKTLVLSKNGGIIALSAADIDNIVAGIKFTTTSAAQGDRDFTIGYIDLADNVSASATATIASTTIATATLSADTGTSTTDFITNTAAQTVSGTLSANLATGEMVKVSLDNGTTWNNATTTVGSPNWSLSGVTLASSNTLKVKAVDAAGNDGTVYSKAYTLDTAPATIVSSLNARYILVSKFEGFNELEVYDINGVKLTFTVNGYTIVTTNKTGTVASINNGVNDSWVPDYTRTNFVEIDLGSLKSIGRVVVHPESGQTGRLAGSNVSLSTASMLDTAKTAIDATKVNAATSFTLPTTMTASGGVNTQYLQGTVGAVMISATGAQNGYLNAGDVVTVSMGMTEVVTVTGTPQLALNIGGETVQANYAGGSGTNTLTFTYTILANQTDKTGISIAASSLTLNGGTIKDLAGNDATLTHSAVADNVNYKVDTTPATVVNSISAQYILISDMLQMSELVVYDVNGNKLDSSTWTIVGSNTTLEGAVSSVKDNNLATFWGSGSWANRTGWVEIDLGTSYSIGQVVVYPRIGGHGARISGSKVSLSTENMLKDANTAIDDTKVSAATSFTLGNTSDIAGGDTSTPYPSGTVGPVMITATGAQNGYLNAGDVVTVSMGMSEAVIVTGTPTIKLIIDATEVTATYVSGTGTNILKFTYTIQAGQIDTTGISLKANSLTLNAGTIKDLAGNNATLTHLALSDNSSYMVDTTAPIVTVSTVTLVNTDNAVVQSSEVGTAYIVKNTVTVTNLASITSASDDNFNSVSITTANTDTNLPLTGLVDGDYKVYTVDSAGNLSSVSSNTVTICTSTPLILDLNGDGVHTTSLENSNVVFDNDLNGVSEKTGWSDGIDGFLALDLNKDGIINNGSELFGNGTTLKDGSKASNGYEALAQYDVNNDRVIDKQDDIFSLLQVWLDSNIDGKTTNNELYSLKDLNIASLNLFAQESSQVDNGNLLGLVSSYTKTDGTTNEMVDVWFSTQQNQIKDVSAWTQDINSPSPIVVYSVPLVVEEEKNTITSII